MAIRGFSVDSAVATGYIGTEQGKLLAFWYDSAPCGNRRCKERFSTGVCAAAPASFADPQATCE
jgi:hypothetical protein